MSKRKPIRVAAKTEEPARKTSRQFNVLLAFSHFNGILAWSRFLQAGLRANAMLVLVFLTVSVLWHLVYNRNGLTGFFGFKMHYTLALFYAILALLVLFGIFADTARGALDISLQETIFYSLIVLALFIVTELKPKGNVKMFVALRCVYNILVFSLLLSVANLYDFWDVDGRYYGAKR